MGAFEIIITTVVASYIGALEIRMRTVREKPSRKEVNELIDLKAESSKVIQADLKEDIQELKAKIDRLIELQLGSRQ